MTRSGVLGVLASLLVAAVPPGTASPDGQGPGPAHPDSAARVPWAVGERLEYKVKFDLFTVGHATLEVLGLDTVRAVPCYHVLFTIHARALFYTLDDSMQSWFGADLISRRFAQHTNDNGTLRAHRYEIMPERGIWVRDDRDTGATVAEPLDEASFFFFARTLPLERDSTYVLPRYFRADQSLVTIRVLGRQRIGVPAGRYQTVAVRPVFKSGGMFGEGGEAIVWFSDDSLRIPLRIRASMPLGTLELSLLR